MAMGPRGKGLSVHQQPCEQEQVQVRADLAAVWTATLWETLGQNHFAKPLPDSWS